MTTERERTLARERKRRQRQREAGGARRVDVRKEQIAETSTLQAPLERPAIALDIQGPKHGLKIAVIPDTQVKPGVPINHLAACGNYLADKRPDVIVCIGDFADMPSLSSYDQPGSLEAEGKRYQADVDSVREAMAQFLKPIRAVKGYEPKLVMLHGNHEDRITRAIEQNPRQLAGVYSLDDLGYAEEGWTVYPFLQPVVIGGVAFCHYFPSGVMGRPITTAAALLRKLHMSCFAGHLQGRDIAFARRADGASMTAIISGSFYQHDEKYLSPLASLHWRGMFMLHEVRNGEFDDMAISVNFLLRKFL
jgi:hypothetical protein